MRKIFIDCGAHTGGSVRHFCKTREDWRDYEIFSFEPDPQHWPRWPVKVEDKEFNVIKKAIWIEDCIKEFHITKCRQRYEGGSTLNKTKHNHNINKYTQPHYNYLQFDFNTIKVECIDINKFIDFKYDDYVVLKMDVEGAEYDIIPYMLSLNTFYFINEFYIEWHNWRCGRCPRPYNVHRYISDEDKEFERRIKNNYNLDCQFWDCIDV